jgi:hypothetical protein
VFAELEDLLAATPQRSELEELDSRSGGGGSGGGGGDALDDLLGGSRK